MGQPEVKEPEITQKSENDLPHTNLSVGEILRRTRLYYNQSLADIEKVLRIRASQIEAIERGDISQLPGRVYAVGFIRSYAEYLGLDGEKMVRLFKHQCGMVKERVPLDFPTPSSETRLPPVWLLLVCLIASSAIISVWWGVDAARTRVDFESLSDVSPVSRVVETAPAPEEPAPYNETMISAVSEGGLPQSMPPDGGTDMPNPDQSAASLSDIETASGHAEAEFDSTEIQTVSAPPKSPTPEDNTILLSLNADSWIEIRDQGGNVVVSRVLKTGDQYYVPDRPDLSMSLGNAAAVDLVVGGEDLARLGQAGEVLRSIPLDVQYLKRQYAIKPLDPDISE